MMKRFALYFALALCIPAPSLVAQTSAPAPRYPFEVGVFAEDFRFGRVSPTLDMPGFGGRISLSPQSAFQVEAEIGYDFTQTFTTSWTNGFTTDNFSTHLRTLRGLAGVKLNKKQSNRLRIFATAKVGFLDFTSSTANIPQGFTNPLTPASTGGTDFLVYGGGGLDYSFGRFGLRFDVGDDLYFDHGHRFNNIRGTFGPTFRF
jgi:hypothetical protein